jgi:hypothetical protein
MGRCGWTLEVQMSDPSTCRFSSTAKIIVPNLKMSTLPTFADLNDGVAVPLPVGWISEYVNKLCGVIASLEQSI